MLVVMATRSGLYSAITEKNKDSRKQVSIMRIGEGREDPEAGGHFEYRPWRLPFWLSWQPDQVFFRRSQKNKDSRKEDRNQSYALEWGSGSSRRPCWISSVEAAILVTNKHMNLRTGQGDNRGNHGHRKHTISHFGNCLWRQPSWLESTDRHYSSIKHLIEQCKHAKPTFYTDYILNITMSKENSKKSFENQSTF